MLRLLFRGVQSVVAHRTTLMQPLRSESRSTHTTYFPHLPTAQVLGPQQPSILALSATPQNSNTGATALLPRLVGPGGLGSRAENTGMDALVSLILIGGAYRVWSWVVTWEP